METEISIEERILASIRRKSSYHKYKPILQDTFFQTEATRQIFSFINEFFQGTNRPKRITIESLKLLILRKIKNKDLRRNSLETIDHISLHKTKDSSTVEETIKDFATRQLIKQGILSGLEQLDNPNPDFSKIKEDIEKALRVSTISKKDFYSYFEEPEQRFSLDNLEPKIATGIPSLDEILDGGFGKGEMVVFLAPPERGKTLVMVNMGVAALHQGKTVGVLTLELSERKIARRYDLRITGRNIDQLREDPARIKNPLASLRKNGCDLVIKDYSSENPRIEDIKSFLINYQERMKKKFDLLIVDYADLILPAKSFKQERFGLKEVYTNLRRLALEFNIPILTASQANKKTMDKGIVELKDFDECFGKAAIADVVIGICQTPEELQEELCRLYVLKNRSSGEHKQIRLTFSPKIMFMGEFHTKRTLQDKRREGALTLAQRI